MRVLSNRIDATVSGAPQTEPGVREFADYISGEERLVRFLPDNKRSAELAGRQFDLHHLLRLSGFSGVGDLVVFERRVVGYTMERLCGTSLAHVARRLDDESILIVLRDIAFAVFGIHSLGYIHGDISLNNVWVGPSPVTEAWLLDLGFSGAIGTRSLTEMSGTVGFMPPESSEASPAHPSSDAFSFGKVIEYLNPLVRNPVVQDRLCELASKCTASDPARRFQDFGILHPILTRLIREYSSGTAHSSHQVPLRLVGMERRTKSLLNRIDSENHGRVVCCVGPSRSGKSELIRAVRRKLQVAGKLTIRISEAESADDLAKVIDQVVLENKGHLPAYIFVETVPEFCVDNNVLSELRRLSQRSRMTILIETSTIAQAFDDRSIQCVLTQSLSQRECTRATSHLLVNPSLAQFNGEAVWAITDGNPGSIREVMTDFVNSGRRGRGEPIDVSRSLALIGRETGPNDTLRILDSKRKSLGAALIAYKSHRRRVNSASLSDFRTIADQFGEMGSIRRRRRWSSRGITAFRKMSYSNDERELECFVQLSTDVFSPEERISELERIKRDRPEMPKRISGMLLCEIGACYIFLKKPDSAAEVLYEALQSIKGIEATSGLSASILNRLGSAKMLLHQFAPARKYLDEAIRFAVADNMPAISARATGNLGLLALYSADPSTALTMFRRHRRATARMQNHAEYFLSLMNETTCLIDLGRSVAAERRAQLALQLAVMLSDPHRTAHAHNNLGWLAMMRCDGVSAMNHLLLALRERRRIGHTHGLATTTLNLARLYGLARDYERSVCHLEEAASLFESMSDEEGYWDCQRLKAKLALIQEDFDTAKHALYAIPLESTALPLKDRFDIKLMQFERALWVADYPLADEFILELDSMEAIGRVQHLSARRLLLSGFYSMIKGDLDDAHAKCCRAAEQLRRADRTDLLIDAVTVMAMLACYAGNNASAGRYISFATHVTSKLNKELQCQTG